MHLYADGTNVAFGYEGGNGLAQGDYRVVTRGDRMGIVTTFTYDAAYKLASASTPANATQTVVQTLRAAEGQGKGIALAGQALPLDSIYTRLDGPRTDVTDVSKWWVNRYGAPVRSRNPVGMESRITYAVGFPALPATLIDAAGMTTVAHYNARGLADTVVARSPYGTSDSSRTTITWDGTWDRPLTVTDPNGLVTTNTYDAVNGNLHGTCAQGSPAPLMLRAYGSGAGPSGCRTGGIGATMPRTDGSRSRTRSGSRVRRMCMGSRVETPSTSLIRLGCVPAIHSAQIVKCRRQVHDPFPT